MRRIILGLTIFVFFASIAQIATPVTAAAPSYSGSDPCNYQCPRLANETEDNNKLSTGGQLCNGKVIPGLYLIQDKFVCSYVIDGRIEYRNALPKPPSLQIIEVWFIRILYALWGFSGIAFTFILMTIGAQYMFSFDNAVAVAEVIKRVQKFGVGLLLVFLSYPMLNTFFRILPINQDASCLSELEMPGFRFFFPEACVFKEESCRYEGSTFVCN